MNETKEHIIVIASKLFLSKSFKEVTMKEIVEETGLSKGTFYYYFESKEQLFMEVLEYFFTTIFVHQYDSYSRNSFYEFYHDYSNALKNIGQKYFAKIKGDPNSVFNMNYFALIFDALKLFPEFKEKMKMELQKERIIWSSVIQDAFDRGEIQSPMTAEELAKTFVALGDGIGMQMIAQGATIDEMRREYMQLWEKLYEQMKV